MTAAERRFIVVDEFLPKGAKYDCEQDAENLEKAHNDTLDDNAWTLDDDLELQTYASQMDFICRKDKDQGRNLKSPANLKLYLNLNEGPQYITRAALLFLTTIYPSCPQLAAFQRTVEEYGFASPKPEGFHRGLNNTTSRAAPAGWPSDEKLTKHYSDAVLSARKSPTKKTPAKKTSLRVSEERKSSAEPHMSATFKLPPPEDGEMTDQNAPREHSIAVSTEKKSDRGMEDTLVSPKKRGRPADSPPIRFTAANAQGTPSPEKRRRIPGSRDGSPVAQDKAVTKSATTATYTLPTVDTTDETCDLQMNRIDTGNNAASRPVTPPFDSPTDPQPKDTTKRLLNFGKDSKPSPLGLPELDRLGEFHARKRDAHNAEMSKLTKQVDELAFRERRAAEVLEETKKDVEQIGVKIETLIDNRVTEKITITTKRVEALEGTVEDIKAELSEVKETLEGLKAYIGKLVELV